MLTGSMNLNRVCITLFALTVFIVSGCSTTGKTPVEPQYLAAPDVVFVSMDGEKTKLSDYRGSSVVLINFWGLRCQSCIEEMPFLERLHNEYDGTGLVILGVNTDGVDGTLLKKFLPQIPVSVTYPLIIDPDFSLVDTFEMVAAPLTILVAKDGIVRYRHEGYEPEIEPHHIQLIEKLLAE